MLAVTVEAGRQDLLFIIAIPFAAGTFHAPAGSGGNQAAVWIILAVILATGIAATLIAWGSAERLTPEQAFCFVMAPRLSRLG